MNRELPDEVLRGQMYYADLDPVIGSEQHRESPQPDHHHCPHHDQGEETPSADPYRCPSILWPAPKLYGYAGADQND